MYRIHDKPSEDKINALFQYLKEMGYEINVPAEITPAFLNEVLEIVKEEAPRQIEGMDKEFDQKQTINEMMLRSLAQAKYSPENIGHFGLALTDYAHFTSPIRRYSDLLVHRALISVCKLGQNGMSAETPALLEDLGEHISMTERRSMAAERDTLDRFFAAYIGTLDDKKLESRIRAILKKGLIVQFDDCGASAYLPYTNLPKDNYFFSEETQQLIGNRTNRTFRMGQSMTVQVENVDPVSGDILVKYIEPNALKDKYSDNPKRPSTAKQAQRAAAAAARRGTSKG